MPEVDGCILPGRRTTPRPPLVDYDDTKYEHNVLNGLPLNRATFRTSDL